MSGSFSQKVVHLFFLGQLAVLLGQDLGEVQVAHLRVQLGVLGPLLHEEAEVWRQGLLGEVWVLLLREEK